VRIHFQTGLQDFHAQFTSDASEIPEPASLTLLVVVLCGLVARRRLKEGKTPERQVDCLA